MNCLWCMEEMNQNISWSNFLLLMKPTGLCDSCLRNLKTLQGDRCRVCSRISESEVCSDCMWWSNHPQGDALMFNHSIFEYNSFMQSVIAKWKYRGDYILGEIFRPYIRKAFSDKFLKENDLIAVPIPLSKERLLERGFNQAEMLASFLPIKMEELFTRVHGEKQSKKTRQDRITTKNPFILEEKLKNPVLLVDDIYTTGTTLRHAAQLLVENGCPEVYAITLIRG